MTPRRSLPQAKFVGPGTGLGPRQIRVIASDGTVDRCGDIVEPSGALLGNYRRNPIVLAQHDSAKPIARCASVGLEGNAVAALIEFPAPGVSAAADEYFGLMKAGIVGAVSIGFQPLAWEPLKSGGLRFTSWELLEISVVSVPANPAALVTEKALGDRGKSRLAARADAIRRRIASTGDDGSPAGNCGRPVGGECGLKDVAECSIHGFGAVGAGTPDSVEDRREAVALLRARHGLRCDPRLAAAAAEFRLWGV